MGDMGVYLISASIVFITVLSLIFGWLSYKVNKMKASLNEDEGLIWYILLLEEAMKKLNRALRSHDTRLDNQLHELSDIKERLDILEAGHPDTGIDYGEVDDDANVIAVWFDGKKYVPEDKSDEDTVVFYADGKVASVETTRPEENRCCATCQHYRPGPDHTCTIRPWLQVTKEYATNAHSACNNYKKLVLYKTYKGIIPDDKIEELQKRIADFNYFYNVGLMSAATYMHRWEELMQNDS